ncbi:MAG: ribose 5-phosphate isomerase B [Candidatus Latescibacterota bacterium]
MKVAIGSDHAGLELKTYLVEELPKKGYEIIDCGTRSYDSVDYSDYAVKVCALVRAKEAEYGILICGTGIGISIAANKMKGIRAGLCVNEFMARLTREHNDANVLALGGMVVGKPFGLSIAEAFLKEPFSNGERHIRRIQKTMELEKER